VGIGGTVAVAVAVGLVVWLFLDAPDGFPKGPSAGSGQENGPGEWIVNSEEKGDEELSTNNSSLVGGVSAQRILFGQSAAFSGPAQELGRSMGRGIEAAFHEVNRDGGMHGRRLELLSLDDAYEPEAAIANTLRLIEEEAVFALIGAVGTPTSRSALPEAASRGIPYIAPFTGAAFLRDAKWDNVVNLRASYNQETEEMVARLTGDLGLERIGVMYQDDSFGRAGYRGVRSALERRGMEPAAIGLYERNTTAVKTALLDLGRGAPEAVILVGAYQPVAELIGWARHTGLDAVFITISFVGSNALAKELGPDGAGVFVTQVVPFPADDSIPIVAAYRRALAAYAPGAIPGFVSFEGYLAGRLAIEGIKTCGPKVTRTCFLAGIRGADIIDLDGFQLRYGDGDNQGSDSVFLTVIGSDGRYHSIRTLSDESLRDRGP
jgi:ABC-type branched-subunit amino acid transport system substrate-binding protein